MPPLPPTPILIACAVWFLHSFAMLSWRMYHVAYQDSRVVPCADSCLVLLFLPMMAGSVTTMLGALDCRPINCVICVFLAIIELVYAAVSFGSPRATNATVILFTVSGVLLIVAVILSMSTDHEYQVWKNDPRRHRMED